MAILKPKSPRFRHTVICILSLVLVLFVIQSFITYKAQQVYFVEMQDVYSVDHVGNESVSSASDNFVVISTTFGSNKARHEDYDFLAPLTALNWHINGFHPIIITVFSEHDTDIYNKTLSLWKMVLPKSHILVPIVTPKHIAVTVAQMSRLFAAHMVQGRYLHNESFLRTTDSDMMIFKGEPFDRPNAGIDIDIFNGFCCIGKNHLADGRTCNQYPMHSVGMKAGLWKSLFPISYGDGTITVLDHMTSIIQSTFDNESFVKHGGKGWFMDQILLGCTIDEAIKNGINMTRGPSRRSVGKSRLHYAGDPLSGLENHADAHLFGFNLESHQEWFLKLVNDTSIFEGHRENVRRYHEAWMQSK
eukprot:605712_1